MFVLVFLCFCSTHAFPSIKYSINESWLFCKGNPEGAYALNYNQKAWEYVSFPHTWNAADATDDTPGFYRGDAWYRKTLRLSSSYKGKMVYMYFEGANQVVDLYINEQYVGQHKGGYTRFCFDITGHIKTGEDNVFAIKVNNAHDSMIPPLSADFTFFGGIYRDVYLLVKEKVHISPQDKASSGVYVSTPTVDKERAELDIRVLLNNADSETKEAIVEHQIYSPQGIKVGEFSRGHQLHSLCRDYEAKAKIRIQRPELWSIDTPNLYSVRTFLKDAQTQEIIDQSASTVGFRWFSFDASKGFFLNGESIKLIGTNRHQCFLGKGNALEDQYHVRDIRLIKEMGGNFLRVSHYPQDPLVLEMCDKLGIVASVEIPIVNAVTEDQEFLDNSLQMAEEMVKQNLNHPSLVMWSYMNEVMLRPPYKEGDNQYLPYCKEVNRQAKAIEHCIRSLDPSRYTMVAFHGSIKAYEEAEMFDVPMIIGWNLYQGWYSGRFDGLDRFLQEYREKYPDKPTLITEYGADVDTRIHSFHPERFDFSVEYGDLYHEHYIQTIWNNVFVAGAAIWNLNDFHSEVRSSAVPHINSKGITELDRRPKNTYYLYKARLTEEPFVKIASTDWILRSGIESRKGVCEQKIKLYSNREVVSVFHNGHKITDLRLNNCVGEVRIPFVQGENHIEAKLEDVNQSDIYRPYFRLIPQTFDGAFNELNVMLGTKRYFEERDGAVIWVPEQEYRPGSWGYVGGEAFRPKTNFGSLPAAEINIKGTSLDPLFQTQRVDIEAFKADVPNGKYAVYLYWADLNKQEEKETLAYNLGNDGVYDRAEHRVFDVSVNSRKIIEGYDIPNEIGTERAIVKKIMADVWDGKGLSVNFHAVKGRTILNAIRILKVD